MKIEKINNNQIRCTLYKSDLASRNLKISELAYGSDKAKELFHDMIEQAANEFGFDAENIPLMIEAIPISSECIVLIITKVDDPEELDTRFSRFSPSQDNFSEEDYDMDYNSLSENIFPSASEELLDDNNFSEINKNSDIMDIFGKVKEYLNNSSNNTSQKSTSNSITSDSHSNFRPEIIRIFLFNDFDVITEAAKAVLPVYNYKNHLYRSDMQHYYLVLEKNECIPVHYNKACNILSEYGDKLNMPDISKYYFDEQYECIIRNRALQTLAKI